MTEKYGSKKCPVGYTERAGYTRKAYDRKSYTKQSGTRIAAAHIRKAESGPTCIRTVGKPGKKNKLPIVLERNDLKKYGYGNIKNLSVGERRRALTRVYEATKTPLSLYRKLIILGTMNEYKNPKLADKFRSDAYWVKDKFGLMRTKPKTSKKYYGSKTNNPKRK